MTTATDTDLHGALAGARKDPAAVDDIAQSLAENGSRASAALARAAALLVTEGADCYDSLGNIGLERFLDVLTAIAINDLVIQNPIDMLFMRSGGRALEAWSEFKRECPKAMARIGVSIGLLADVRSRVLGIE